MSSSPLAEAEYTTQRSRFYAVIYDVTHDAEIKDLLKGRQRAHKKACHHCWASRITNDEGQLLEQARDDREVGRPGLKILEVMRRHDLKGVLVVSRIFGGVKLGPGNVGRAFAHVAGLVASAFEART